MFFFLLVNALISATAEKCIILISEPVIRKVVAMTPGFRETLMYPHILTKFFIFPFLVKGEDETRYGYLQRSRE